jgi:Flp pilus assembly pilin Flp
MRKRRHRDERGTAIVEFALIAPILFLILFGIIEFGFVFKDSLTLTNMTRSGVRTGAAVGNATSPDADFQILQAIAGASGALSSNINYVIVFKASSSSGTVPSACITAAQGGTQGVSGECNIYSPTEISTIKSQTWAQQSGTGNWGCGTTTWDGDYCPGSRIVSQSAGPDYLGVSISAHHSNVTGFFHSLTMTDTSIMRLEPQTP